MDIKDYDQYIPERELNINFRIPRKRTAAESIASDYEEGYSVQTSRFDTIKPLSDFSGLSGAASRASAHSNYRDPVSYTDISKVDTSVKPPMMTANKNVSISYPRISTYLGSSTTKIWGQGINRSPNQSVPKFDSTWSPFSSSRDNQSLKLNWNSNVQDRNWNKSQTSNWNGRQDPKWGNDQSSTWNNTQASKMERNPYESIWNNARAPNRNKGQDPKLENALEENWKREREFNRYNTQAPTWTRRQERNDVHAQNLGSNHDSKLDKAQASRFISSQSDQGRPFNENCLFTRNRDYSDRQELAEDSLNWNDNNFNRSIRGRGEKKQWGFRNDDGNQGNFGRGMSVLDDDYSENSSYNTRPGWKPKNFRPDAGQKNFGRYWNKSEKPKKPKIATPPVVISDTSDETLPKDLRLMFQPLFCKLCSLQMSSNVMAKMHYSSKNHEKKIRKYLIDHSEKTGEPLHPRATTTSAQDKKEKVEDKDPKNFYCELCDLQLTGKQHADCHYMGKSHNAVRMGRKRPAGQGFFDANGKWIRKNKEPKLEYADGEDTFGMDFKKKTEDSDEPSAEPVNKPQQAVKTQEQFTCFLCVVNCVSQDQLNIHFGGAKHKKKLKANGVSPESFTLPEENSENKESEIITIPVKGTTANDTDNSLKSKYMTPNGYFYCEKCNLTVNSEIQFKQHLSSKNHAKKVNAMNTQ